MKYRLNKYLSLKGKVVEVVLPDSAYGAWVVYEDDEPRFYVSLFGAKSKSDFLAAIVLEQDESDFEGLLLDINQRFNRNLSLSSKGRFSIKISSKLVELKLGSLPFEWLEHYIDRIKAPWERYPKVDYVDMFWRMGKGEDCIMFFSAYYNSLNFIEREAFKARFRPPKEWAGFYG